MQRGQGDEEDGEEHDEEARGVGRLCRPEEGRQGTEGHQEREGGSAQSRGQALSLSIARNLNKGLWLMSTMNGYLRSDFIQVSRRSGQLVIGSVKTAYMVLSLFQLCTVEAG